MRQFILALLALAAAALLGLRVIYLTGVDWVS